MNTFLTDAERLEAIAVGIQAYKNPNATFEAGKSTFSKNKAMEAMRAALIKSAGGDSKIDFKKMIRGHYNETFALIEEILKVTTRDYMLSNTFFQNLVDFRDSSVGDLLSFRLQDKTEFIVADTSVGTQAVRAQKLMGGTNYTVPTSVKAIKTEEELQRIIAGQIDWLEYVDACNKAILKRKLNDVATAFTGITSSTPGMQSNLITASAGTYSDADLLTKIIALETTTGMSAKILGTEQAVSKIDSTPISDSGKEDFYNSKCVGKFRGREVMAMNQLYKPGTTTDLFSNNDIYIFAGDTKPVKHVTTGEFYMTTKDPMANADMSQTLFMAYEDGTSVIVNEAFAVYKFS